MNTTPETPSSHPSSAKLPPLSEEAILQLAERYDPEDFADILRAYNGLPRAAPPVSDYTSSQWADAVFWAVVWLCIAAVIIFGRR
jgi:hypothetical protein